jgi:hypothetical protein
VAGGSDSVDLGGRARGHRAAVGGGADAGAVFLFFSNRAGCLGSLVVSLVVTLLLVAAFTLL